MKASPNYDKFPTVRVSSADGACVQGWDAIAERLRQAMTRRGRRKIVLTVECYTGVEEARVLAELKLRLAPALAVHARDAMLPPEKIDALVWPFLGGSDPVFGFLSGLTLPQFFDPERLSYWRTAVEQVKEGVVLVVG